MELNHPHNRSFGAYKGVNHRKCLLSLRIDFRAHIALTFGVFMHVGVKPLPSGGGCKPTPCGEHLTYSILNSKHQKPFEA